MIVRGCAAAAGSLVEGKFWAAAGKLSKTKNKGRKISQKNTLRYKPYLMVASEPKISLALSNFKNTSFRLTSIDIASLPALLNILQHQCSSPSIYQ